jgi:hypothetical protein
VKGLVVSETQNDWAITIRNTTLGWSFSTTASFNGPLASAEWIVEDITRCSPITCWFESLPGFGNVNFGVSNSVAVGAAAATPPDLTTATPFSVNLGGSDLVTPSTPSCAKDGFSAAEGPTAPGAPGPFFTNTSLPNGIEGSSYSARLFVSGLVGAAPFSEGITLKQSSLPPGLTLNEQNGEITGVPKSYGTFPFTAEVKDVGTLDTLGNMASCAAPMSIRIFRTIRRPQCWISRVLGRVICS